MQHRSTIAIFGEWQRLAFERSETYCAPKRENIEPRRLGRHISDLFFMETDRNGDLVFRLGGTRICTLFGRELKGVRFLSLWPERDRPALHELTQNINAMQIPAISRHDGISLSGRHLGFEMLLAPLRSRKGQISLLGSLAVLDNVSWVGADPLVLGHLNSIEPLAPDLVLAQEIRKTVSATVNASGHKREWTKKPVVTAPSRKAAHLRIIPGGKA